MEAMSSFFHLDKKTANDEISTKNLGLPLQVISSTRIATLLAI